MVFVPAVRMHLGLWARFLAFCSFSPVVKVMPSSAHTANSGVAWGRPSARTVHNVNFWSRRIESSVCAHGRTPAFGPENGPRSVLGDVVMTEHLRPAPWCATGAAAPGLGAVVLRVPSA